MTSMKVGVRINIPYLQGAYLALNAVADAYFLGDGPSCLFDKAAHIHGRHDLFSTLLSCDSGHRVQFTGVNVFNIAGNLESEMKAMIRRVADTPRCGVFFMGSMPMCTIAGTDYERLLREALRGCEKPALLMPRRTAVSGDWLDGYAAVLESLAAGVDLRGAEPRPENVALVGYFMDRNEGDHWGNLKELERMVRAVGLNPVSIWLSGKSYEELRQARHAGTIISLPHGRKAGRLLAKRLGARLVEAELPFGLEASRRFAERLGREFSREQQAHEFISRELDEVVPRLEWVVPHAFLGRRFAFSGDPHYAAGFVEQIEDLGGRIEGTIVLGGEYHLTAEQRETLSRRRATTFEPLPQEIRETWGRLAAGGADLIVGSSFAFREFDPGPRWLEFGFPSECTHFLRDEPFLGFQGALAFLSRAANEVVKGLNLRAPAGRSIPVKEASSNGR